VVVRGVVAALVDMSVSLPGGGAFEPEVRLAAGRRLGCQGDVTRLSESGPGGAAEEDADELSGSPAEEKVEEEVAEGGGGKGERVAGAGHGDAEEQAGEHGGEGEALEEGDEVVGGEMAEPGDREGEGSEEEAGEDGDQEDLSLERHRDECTSRGSCGAEGGW
jgi:hypothetical protein